MAEHIQTLCLSDPAFARKVMHPRKSMIHCIWYINRQAREFIEKEVKDNDFPKENGIYGGDVPDGLCYQWAVDYFNDPEAKEDHEDEEKFVPKPYYGGSASKTKPKEKAKKEQPKLAYTVFQASDSFITCDHRDGAKSVWRTAMLSNLERGYGFVHNQCAFYSRRDEQRVFYFCGSCLSEKFSGDGFLALHQMQQQIRDQETMRRRKARERKIRARLSGLPPLPRDTEHWLRREVLPAYFFYDYKKGRSMTTNEFVLFPKHLQQAHDQAQGRVKQRQVEKFDTQIASQRKRLKRQYQFKSGGLVVLPPHSAQEIVMEGQTLHHCVGRYAEQMAEGDCAILFLRQEKEVETPYYTVEVQGDNIIQVRGAHNCAPTPEVKEFLNAWEEKKHLKGAA